MLKYENFDIPIVMEQSGAFLFYRKMTCPHRYLTGGRIHTGKNIFLGHAKILRSIF